MTEPVFLRYGPSRLGAAGVAGAALVAIIAAVLTSAPTGRLLLGTGAVVLAIIAIADTVFSPRLTATTTGIAIFTPTVRTRLRWADIDHIQMDARSHLGLASRSLEIDAGELLVLLGKRSLGCDPADACRQLLELKTRSARG